MIKFYYEFGVRQLALVFQTLCFIISRAEVTSVIRTFEAHTQPIFTMPSSSSKRLFDLLKDDSQEEMIAIFWQQMAQLTVQASESTSGGSRPGKGANITRDYAGAHIHYTKKYFWQTNVVRPGTSETGPEQPEHAFERLFRIPRAILDRIMAICFTHYP